MSTAVNTCNADDGTRLQDPAKAPEVFPPRAPGEKLEFDGDVGCTHKIDGVKQCMATGAGAMRPGVAQLSDQMLASHELLQAAKNGDPKGLAKALEKNAWVETRRPLVMRPQRTEGSGPSNNANVGLTPLMYASMNGSEECVRRLIYANAQLNAIDEDGETALHLASKEGNLDACRLLIKAKADANIRNDDGKTALEVSDTEIKPALTQLLQRRAG